MRYTPCLGTTPPPISMETSTLAAVASSVVLSRKPHLLLPLNSSRSLPRTRFPLAICCSHSHSHASPPPLPLSCTTFGQEEVTPSRLRLRRLMEEFNALPDADRARHLLAYAAALPRLSEADRVVGCVAQNGNCIVHDMFGHEVVEKIKEEYCDAFLTAHFEVPGEMFSLSMEAKTRGMGVVGSTQNILDFIKKHLKQALDRNVDDHLQFVLGTESGMITSIVAAVRQLFNSYESSKEGASIEVEIVFPVSSDAISKTCIDDSHHFGSSVANDLEQISIVPGVFSGEGCSIHGGCASCPYMKMNSLESLLKICQQLPDEDNRLSAYQASRLNAKTSLGKLVAEVGCEPILHMRHFQATKRLPDKLIHQVIHGNRGEPL